jgi:hypothetical protein
MATREYSKKGRDVFFTVRTEVLYAGPVSSCSQFPAWRWCSNNSTVALRVEGGEEKGTLNLRV